jgi:hypothetical protein
MNISAHSPGGFRGLAALVAGLALVGWSGLAGAQVPQQFHHQGRLLNDSGEPVTGERQITFTLYDSKTGGAVLWQTQKQVEFDDSGFYGVTLGGDSNPIQPRTLEGGEAYLGIKVGDQTELTPRMSLESTPFSIVAERARNVAEGSIESSDLASDFSVGSDHIDGTTLESLNCSDGEVPVREGQQYTCRSTIATQQECPQGQVAVGLDNSGNIMCREDESLSESQVEQAVQGDFAPSDQACGPDQKVRGLDQQGSLICETDRVLSESEVESAVQGDVAAAGQNCKSGMVVAGIAQDGTVVCRKDKDTDTDTQLSETEVESAVQGDFAASGQNCQSGQVVAGIEQDGTVVCRDDKDTDTQLSDAEVRQAAQGAFAGADQDCQSGMVVDGIDKNGNIECRQPDSPRLLKIKRTKQCVYTEGKSDGWYSAGREITVTTTRKNATIKVDYRDRVHCDDDDGGGDWCSITGRLVVDGQPRRIVYEQHY